MDIRLPSRYSQASRSTESMKLVPHGNRDRIVHPTMKYDAAMWTTEALQGRTEHQIPTQPNTSKNSSITRRLHRLV